MQLLVMMVMAGLMLPACVTRQTVPEEPYIPPAPPPKKEVSRIEGRPATHPPKPHKFPPEPPLEEDLSGFGDKPATYPSQPQDIPSAPPPKKEVPRMGAKPATSPPHSHKPMILARLQDKADEQMKAGDLERAFATAERALRVDPSDPHLWHLMAQIQLRRGNLSQAEQLARKSNLLAGDDPLLQSENWRIIAATLRRRGVIDEAEAAEQQAEALNPSDPRVLK